MNETEKHKILLWSPFGCGEHYCGPAKYTHRMYSKFDLTKFQLSLAHGFAQQDESEIFADQHLVSDLSAGSWSKLRFVQNAKNWMRRNVNRYQLFHAVSGYETTVVAAGIAKKAGLPVVLFVSNENGGLASKGGLGAWLGVYRRRQELAKSFDAIVAMSVEIEAELKSFGIPESHIVSIPNFADTDIYFAVSDDRHRELRAELNLRDCLTVVFVGRVCERKRPHLLAEAIGLLNQRGVDAQAVFVGPYEEGDSYFQQIDETARLNNYRDRLVFTGFTNAVPKWLQASNVFCLPSANEGMPGALIEAVSCGLPAVVSPFSSANQVIGTDRLGIVLSEDSLATEIADAVTVLAQKDSQSFRNERGMFVEKNYSLNSVSRQYSSLFEKLIGANNTDS